MELVEGETLGQRLSKGLLPVEEALGMCRQIAERLEAAHEKGRNDLASYCLPFFPALMASCILECLRFDCRGILQQDPVVEYGFLIHVYLIAKDAV